MDQLNKDECRILITYMDYNTVKDLIEMLIHSNPIQACNVLQCVVEQLIKEREEIERGIQSISDKLDDIDDLSNQLNNLNNEDSSE